MVIEIVPLDLLYDESAIKVMYEIETLRTKHLRHYSELDVLVKDSGWNEAGVSRGSFPFPVRRAEYPWAVLKADLHTNMKILDVGSGPSLFPIYLASKSHEVYSIDKDEMMANCIAPKLAEWSGCNVNYSIGDATKIDFDDNTFDRVFCISVLEHLEEKIVSGEWVNKKEGNLDVEAISEMLRVLKPGGLLILTLDWSEAVGEKRSYTLQDIYNRLLNPYRSFLLLDRKPQVNWSEMSEKFLETWRTFPPFYYEQNAWAIGVLLRKNYSE